MEISFSNLLGEITIKKGKIYYNLVELAQVLERKKDFNISIDHGGYYSLTPFYISEKGSFYEIYWYASLIQLEEVLTCEIHIEVVKPNMTFPSCKLMDYINDVKSLERIRSDVTEVLSRDNNNFKFDENRLYFEIGSGSYLTSLQLY